MKEMISTEEDVWMVEMGWDERTEEGLPTW